MSFFKKSIPDDDHIQKEENVSPAGETSKPQIGQDLQTKQTKKVNIPTPGVKKPIPIRKEEKKVSLDDGVDKTKSGHVLTELAESKKAHIPSPDTKEPIKEERKASPKDGIDKVKSGKVSAELLETKKTHISSPDEEEPIKKENISPEKEINKIKIGHILTELLETEKVYVSELLSIINGYKVEAHHASTQHILPYDLDHKLNVIFGNLEEIYTFHSEVFLRDLENCITSLELVALCFLQKRDSFFKLYSFYCQNISKSEEMRESAVELHSFFQSCQQKLGHKLPLAAYLLKPVQRITKYQLLLKDLPRYSGDGKSYKESQQALDCMLVVLKCVNDSMHQIDITGFPGPLDQQGELLLQGSLSVWMESKRDLRLRLKPMQRHLFLYKKTLLFCKPNAKATHNKATYQYKHHLKMSQIGLTESVKGDPRKFEVWLQGRQEVHTIQAANVDQKNTWVNEIKKVLFNQLEEIRGEKIKQYALTHNNHSSRPLRQTTSWEKQKQQVPAAPIIDRHRALSCDTQHTHSAEAETPDYQGTQNWSSDDDDDEDHHGSMPSGHYVALADYCAVGNSEVNMKEGDIVELLKVGCAGWWFVKMIGTSVEGWAPASYLENFQYKTSRSNSSRSQDRFNE
ncbi:unnamed protein product [Acanthoscelides obtectus]|uniref:Guanine nucleotide exchange factor DBS n=1 Tax=Acanthoscelides obtectus TaxID=200917 RepID=A0A9P0PH85_ACAOB|nr:unnamed protein product [Acanthoscelides obtectus]CAK1628270.1 Guanine nucleotide exchange factor DBS [Acanthoscelides obtectus]